MRTSAEGRKWDCCLSVGMKSRYAKDVCYDRRDRDKEELNMRLGLVINSIQAREGEQSYIKA